MPGIRWIILFALLLPLHKITGQESGGDNVVSSDGAPLAANIQLTLITTGFNHPLYATHAGDGSGRLFLVEQSGKIWILRDGIKSARPFLDVSDLISPVALTDAYTERGLLGLVFHPDYEKNGVFFINYTDHSGHTVVARYQASADRPDVANKSSATPILYLLQPTSLHNGGHLAFGPDGYLYIALGDGGPQGDLLGTGQNRQLLLGSILRIDVDGAAPYAIPPDNPFVGYAAARDEIWSYGWRNPWRLSFDRETGDMYIGDVGFSNWEEVNFEPADSAGGLNYGWNVYEGNELFAGGEAPNYVPPFFVYGHSHGCAVTGGYVYRGAAIEELQGAYLFGDFCSGRIWAARRNRNFNWRLIELYNSGITISSFGEDEAGELYVVDHALGRLFRIDPSPSTVSKTVIARDTAPQNANVSLSPIATGFTRPLYLTHAGDGSQRLFLLEQTGKIWIIDEDGRAQDPFLDVSALISPSADRPNSEQGLLGLAFHPDYKSSGVFFLSYTDHDGSSVIARYMVSSAEANVADAASGEIIFQLPQPYANHNGGHIEFGPDGYLYVALGDGGSANDPLGAGQNRRLLLGSILRIDVDVEAGYAIPPDNPFVGDAAARDEIWSYGWRNPWRLSFDRETGDMYIGDVGQNAWEEVNIEPASSKGGGNYGWNVWEGNHTFAGGNAPNHVPPLFEYSHAFGCSVTGGYVYRGAAIPDWQAVYLFGDYCSGRIWSLWRDREMRWQVNELMKTDMAISSFGEDEAGEVYVIDYGGTLFRFDPAGD